MNSRAFMRYGSTQQKVGCVFSPFPRQNLQPLYPVEECSWHFYSLFPPQGGLDCNRFRGKYLVAQVMLILLVSPWKVPGVNPVITACRPEKRVDAGSIDLNPSLVKKLARPSRFLKPRRSCQVFAWRVGACRFRLYSVTGGRSAQSSGRRSSGHITSSRASASDAAACAAICLLGPTPRPTTCSPILTSTVNWRA